MDLLHQQFRRLCKILVDVDEWGQINLLNLLARYARTMLSKPLVDGERRTEDVDSDLRLLLTRSEPLLQSQNAAVSPIVFCSLAISTPFQVVIAVTRVFFYVGPPSQIYKVVHPLLRLLNHSKEVERVVLADILILIQTVPVGLIITVKSSYKSKMPLFHSISSLHSIRGLLSALMTSGKLSGTRWSSCLKFSTMTIIKQFCESSSSVILCRGMSTTHSTNGLFLVLFGGRG